MVLCSECLVRTEETPGSEICFHCRVASVGFTFRGASYGRRRFHDATISEKRAEVLGDKVLGVDVEPSSNYGW
jgi:hypothetical protein